MTKSEKSLCKQILVWYSQNKRDLPWRKNRTPYRILVSEIMLQQTQVDRVVPKYLAFLKAFPNTKALAEAKTADVIKAWKGLGYNRRALYLQKTAQAVQTQYRGRFPKDLEKLKALPGIGDYTARAVLSFSFDLPVPVLDTNHRKFYQRTFFGSEMKRDAELLEQAEEVVQIINHKSKIINLKSATASHRRSEAPPHGGGGRGPAQGGKIFNLKSEISLVHHWNQALMDFMSAVARNDTHPLVQKYIKKYPAVEKAKKQKSKKSIPFKQTDRYFRGRIIDKLREEERVMIDKVREMFHYLTEERFLRIVEQLAKDGLIVLKKKSILFP